MNAYLDTSIVDKAIRFAVDAHANTERRGKGFPYVIHVLEAMEIAATMTNDPEILAAAALHDTVEDTSVTLEEIRREFGDRVAGFVEAETDKCHQGNDERSSWRARKQEGLDRIASSSREAKMVALGDKLSNMRAIARDYKALGEKFWNRFHAPGGKSDHEWRYRNLAIALDNLAGTDAYSEFLETIDRVFGSPKPELINLDDYKKSGDGFTATGYSDKAGDRMIKMYCDFVPPDIPEKEFRVSGYLRGAGFNIPRAYRLVTDGSRIGVEFETIKDKISFARAISRNPDKLEEYTVEFARMCREFHSTPCDTRFFEPVGNRFLKAVNESELFDGEQKKKIALFIRSIPETGTCIHGDMHIGNALMAGGREYWIDLPDFAYGNPLFDLGMMHFLFSLEQPEELLTDLFHMGKAQTAVIWSIFEREYFGPDADLESINSQLDRIAALYMIYFANMGKIYPNIIEYVNEKIIRK